MVSTPPPPLHRDLPVTLSLSCLSVFAAAVVGLLLLVRQRDRVPGMPLAILLVLLCAPAASSKAFSAFNCRSYDHNSAADTSKSFLLADPEVLCCCWIDVEIAAKPLVDHARKLAAPQHAAEGRPAPDTARHELERTS